MGRPTTKEDLLLEMEKSFNQLMTLFDSLTEEEKIKPLNFDENSGKENHWVRDKYIKDIFVHLYVWQELLLDWYNHNTKGIEKQFLMEGYNWKTYGDMNIKIKEDNNSLSLKESIKRFKNTHKQVYNLVNELTNEHLFRKNQFSWTKGATFGSYCVSSTSSHYLWAYKKINKFKKQL